MQQLLNALEQHQIRNSDAILQQIKQWMLLWLRNAPDVENDSYRIDTQMEAG